MTPSRRSFLLAALAILGAGKSIPAFAAGVRGKKFVFILLRGAMDGLSALIPRDDALIQLRQNLLPPQSERLTIGQGFDLHPQLSFLHELYEQGEASFVPAAATSYRSRSHFDGQDVLELLGRSGEQNGWLNRVAQSVGGGGLSVGHSLPLAMRGDASVDTWSPPIFESVSEDLLDRLMRLYQSEGIFHDELTQARMVEFSGTQMTQDKSGAIKDSDLLAALGDLMMGEDAPGIGMISIAGWDTHAQQERRLGERFATLSDGLRRLKSNLGTCWENTAIIMCSEFGRTAAANGTGGTDHGTGGLVTLLGGAIKGRRIHGDWPGVSPAALYEGRDVAPANQVEAVINSVLRDHIGLAGTDLAYSADATVRLDGLIR